MKRISKIIILLFISVILISCGKKSYVVFDYNCNGIDYHKCELKNNKLNCNVETPTCGEYTFKGWYRANKFETPIDLSSNFNKNEIIYARWEKGNGRIEPSSSEEPTSTIITPGIIDVPSSSSEIPSSSKEEPSSSQQQPVDPPKPEKTYTLSFNLNGGTGGQTAPISGVKYNQTLPSINQNKPIKPGYTFQGWYDNQNGGTQYYNSSNSPVRKYDKKGNITLYAHWTINTLSIQHNGNDGTWANPSKDKYGVNSSNTVIVKSTNKVYQKVLNYGEKLDSSGLVDCNGSWFKWTRSGYTVENKKEYIIGSTVIDQSKSYSAVELSRYAGCDLSKTDCTITVKVNWKKEDYSGVNYNNFSWTFYSVNSGPIKKYTSENVYSYAIWAPKNISDLNGMSLPVIIWLHGAGEMGNNRPTDGEALLNSGLLKVISDWKKYSLDPVPAIILAPQSPSNWGTKLNYDTIKALLAYTENVYYTNPSKRVLMGHSKGGKGVVHIAYKYQDLNLYAAIPLSGGPLRYDYDNKNIVIQDDGKDFFSKLKIRGYGETRYPRDFFEWIGKPSEYIYYADWDIPPYPAKNHGKVPERAMTTDSNKDGVSDLMYWLFGEAAKISNYK